MQGAAGLTRVCKFGVVCLKLERTHRFWGANYRETS
jgi:hypothetical protein